MPSRRGAGAAGEPGCSPASSRAPHRRQRVACGTRPRPSSASVRRCAWPMRPHGPSAVSLRARHLATSWRPARTGHPGTGARLRRFALGSNASVVRAQPCSRPAIAHPHPGASGRICTTHSDPPPHDWDGAASVLENMANAWRDLGQPGRAFEYCELQLAVARRRGGGRQRSNGLVVQSARTGGTWPSRAGDRVCEGVPADQTCA